ncbi:MAG TPA: prepilin-type N-terminal cleavage/methylation domain-containing protein, partial [Ramlibacter sp.]|nr:prepilin-type N-terminal cleavage/methylation domain-containing protein [Ramlibacter sp.]
MKRTFILHGGSRARALGFSLVELMVASAVGLIVTLAVTGSVLTMGRQFSIVGANVSAQGSAQIALSLLDAAGRGAGAGFYNNGRLICPTWNAWNGTTVISDGAALMPARIVAGASNTAPDTLVFTGATGAGALAALPVMETAAPGANVKISNGATLAAGDLAVIGVPGSALPCTLFQVTNTPSVVAGCSGNATSCQLLVRTPNSGLNPNPTTFTTDSTFGFTTSALANGPAVVSRVGSAAAGFRQDAFGVQCNSLVRFNAFVNATAPACTASPLAFGAGVDAIATDVVMMQAQYGVSASAASDVVTQWVEPTGAT